MLTVTSLVDNPAKIIYQGNLTTIGKKPRKDWQPTYDWCFNQFLAEDSTLDRVSLEIVDDQIQSDVCSQIVRHKTYGATHSVQSKRPDWTGVQRPSDPKSPRMLCSVFTVRAFLKMMRERLCSKAMADTQVWAKRVKEYLVSSDDIFLRALGDACVPTCIYRGGCPYSRGSCKRMIQIPLVRYQRYNA